MPPSSPRPLPPIRFVLFLTAVLVAIPAILSSQTAEQFSGMKWRLLGPFRAGRVTAVAGVPGDPNTYYIGTPGGGVWKSGNGGRVWSPIFDSIRVPSIGALAVAPSAANVLYVGTGEQMRGKGMFRSSDNGATWTSAGLDDVPYIQAIVVDPQNPDVVVVGGNSIGFGILWRPYPKSATSDNRGIFRTEDGGKTWKKVYSNDQTFGVVDMCADPNDPRTMYAVEYYPGSGTGPSAVAPTSDIVKSSDGGATWAPLASKGLPEKARSRMGIAVAAGENGRRMYAIVEQGFYRSDDAGATWYQSTKDPRAIGSPYFSRIFADTHNPDILYVAQTSMYRSTDGGKTFEAFAGAPSGDDFHLLWIDPQNSRRMLVGVDQGAMVSVDAGGSWTSWYNQPTGQFYHVSTDNQFPYRVYGAQQDSGTAGILSRSDYGEILLQDWFSIGGFEYAFIVPDPLHPDFVYSGGWFGSVIRYQKSTAEIATVFERGKKYRSASMAPLAFSPHDPHVLYMGTQFVLKTADGGGKWQEISPDLTGYVEKEEKEGVGESTETPRPPSISALAPSPVDKNLLWAGTTNRLVQITRDGGASWQNVTPPGLAEPVEILYVEPSHQNAGTAYLTIGATRFSTPPYVLRTHDYGRTWEKIVNGFPADEMVRVVREDPKQHCLQSTTAPRTCSPLLYAGTDTGVYFSWDDGDHWQPLSLNLPPTPVTDLTVHGDDLAISTFGRGLWVLDDVSALRDFSPTMTMYLFSPADAVRVRWDNFQDTPYPAETPAGQNPPDGAIIDYYLKNAATSELTLTIYDEKHNQIAQFSSTPKPVTLPPANVPEYWFAPPVALTKDAGLNRFAWNLRYPAPPTLPYGYYGKLLGYTEYTLADHAVPGQTPRQQPQGPFVAPGKYTAELRYEGRGIVQPFIIKADPRIHASQAELNEQRDLALEIARGMSASYASFTQVEALRKALGDQQKPATGTDAAQPKTAADALAKKLDMVENGTRKAPGLGPVNMELARLIVSVESADMRPVDSVRAAVQQSCDALQKSLAAWQHLNQQDIPTFNQESGEAALPVVTVSTAGCRQ